MLSQRVLRPIALFAAIELFIVGGIGAWLAVRLQFPYAYLTPLSLLVYGAAGFYGCRAGAAGWMGGGIVAFLDAVSWAAFRCRPPADGTPSVGRSEGGDRGVCGGAGGSVRLDRRTVVAARICSSQRRRCLTSAWSRRGV